MIIFFITIVFIAELFLTYMIVYRLILLDNQIIELNNKFSDSKSKILESMQLFKKIVGILKSSFSYVEKYIDEKKCNFNIVFQKKLIVLLLFFILKLPFKNIFAAINILYLPVTLYKLISKCKK